MIETTVETTEEELKKTELRILLISAETEFAAGLIHDLYKYSEESCIIFYAKDLSALNEYAASTCFDFVLVDIDHNSQHYDILARVRAIWPIAPVLVLVDGKEEERGIASLQLGAQDYCIKGLISSEYLFKEIKSMLAKQRKDLFEPFEHSNKNNAIDNLTGLAGRALLTDRLQQALAICERYHEKLAVMVINLDSFKTINEGMGFQAGDELLQKFSKRIKLMVRDTDTFARLGGDEFILLLTRIRSGENAAKVAHLIVENLKKPFILENQEQQEYIVTASIGIAVYPSDGTTKDELLKNATFAMRHAKTIGMNNYQFYCQEMNKRSREHLLIASGFKEAIEKEQFKLYFQVQVDYALKKVVGLEALIRWQHPVLGLLSPDKFLPLAEESGFINIIGLWVLDTALGIYASTSFYREQSIRFSINLSTKQLYHPGFCEQVAAIIEKHKVSPRTFVLEVTESVDLNDIELAKKILTELKTMGFAISMDDFGTGYACLEYVSYLPADEVKIDKKFIADLLESKSNQAVVKGILAIGQHMGLRVIAEGVEELKQAKYLLANGCSQMQGYLFSKAVPHEWVPEMLLKAPWDLLQMDLHYEASNLEQRLENGLVSKKMVAMGGLEPPTSAL